jgi:hypothetical protein
MLRRKPSRVLALAGLHRLFGRFFRGLALIASIDFRLNITLVAGDTLSFAPKRLLDLGLVTHHRPRAGLVG